MFRLSSKKQKHKPVCSVPEFIKSMKESMDFVSYSIDQEDTLCLFYYKSTVESLIVKQFILTPLKRELENIHSINDLINV
ncbi:MAG: spore germination protein, partial [Bacillus cereus]|nr:spore germination protein [Bacillus cereus]